MGRDSPGALLDMLAEVASQTLHSEKKQKEVTTTAVSRSKTKAIKLDPLKKKTQDSCYFLAQLLSMPATHLIKQFTTFTSDELKRQYSYTCTLVPDCGQRYTSFASEGRARMSIKAHLLEHLEYFRENPDTYTTFTATTLNKYRKSKTNLQSKKIKIQAVKKPLENLNKENKEVSAGKCTSYLRKILSNDMNLKEFENHKMLESKVEEDYDKKSAQNEADTKFLGDHSYYEQAKHDIMEDNAIENSASVIVDGTVEQNIVLMVVENDGVHVKELPYITQNLAQENYFQKDSDLLESQGTFLEESSAKSMENLNSAKPKGKAKFIGTSKEEREMALALMERIKKKGNPTGNNLQCRICDPPRSFTAPTTLVSHYRSHAGIKPYECRICRAVFTRRHSLKYHMLIHQNQTRFTCADCEKKFRHPSHFREHRRRHTGEAPFGCEDCGQRFKTRNTYKRHLKTRHGKVLTTSGELLCLSEEDFQKVRTNRRKKSDYSLPNEDALAANIIVQYQKCEVENCPGHKLGNESCPMQDINDNGTVWMNYCDFNDAKLKSTAMDKTDLIETIETEVAIEDVENGARQCEFSEEHEAVILDHDPDNLQMMHSDILYHDSEALYSVEGMNEYMSVDYTDAQLADEENAFVYQDDEDNLNEEFGDGYTECIKNLKTRPDCSDEGSEEIPCGVKVITEQMMQYEETEYKRNGNEKQAEIKSRYEEDMDEEISEKDSTKDVPNIHSALQPELLVSNEASEMLLDSATESSAERTNEKSSPGELEELAEAKIENAGKVVPQVKLLCNQNDAALQLLKNGKMTLFGKKTQAIKFVQNGKQNGILLFTSGGAKVAGFLKVEQNNIVIKGLKTLPVVKVSDK